MFYGMTFNEFVRQGRGNTIGEAIIAHDDEYSALKFANEQWQVENPNDGESLACRLLVVVDQASKRIAYFQFSDFETCNKFSQTHDEILWTTDNEYRKWNGNIHLMKY